MSNKHIYIKNTFYYISLPAIRNALSFITLPIMTRFLSPGDYGTAGIITMLVSFSSVLFLGLNASSYRFFFKYKDDEEELRHMLSTNMIFIVAAALLYGIILMIAFPFLNGFFFSNKLGMIWIVLAMVQFALLSLNTINQGLFQASHAGKQWAFNELASIVVQVPLCIFLVVTRLFTFEAIIISALAAEAVKFILIFMKIGRRYYELIFSKKYFRESLAYSWPTLPTTLIAYGYSYLDRILLSRFYGLYQVGLLEMSSRISIIAKMIMDGVDGVVSPINLEMITENTESSLKRMAVINLKVIFILTFIALALILATRELIVLLTTSAYYGVMYIAPIYIYNYIFAIMSFPAYWLIYHRTDKVYLKIITNLIFLCCSVAINILLIPRFGVMGAAAAIFISSAITQIVQFIIGLRITPIPIDLKSIVILFSALLLNTCLVYYMYYINLDLALDIFFKVLMLASYFVLGLILKITSVKEISEILLGFRSKIYQKVLEYRNE